MTDRPEATAAPWASYLLVCEYLRMAAALKGQGPAPGCRDARCLAFPDGLRAAHATVRRRGFVGGFGLFQAVLRDMERHTYPDGRSLVASIEGHMLTGATIILGSVLCETPTKESKK